MDSQLTIGPIGQISLLCRSAASTEAWYRDTLKLPHLFTFGGLVFFECAGTRLYFREVPDTDWRPGSTIYFDVSDIQVAHKLLMERGVTFVGAPHLIHRHADGSEEWMAFFADPDGNALALMTTASAADPARPEPQGI